MKQSVIEQKVLEKIGNPVNFDYPDKPQFNGHIKDRCVMLASSWQGGKSADVVDLIEFTEPENFTAIRFGYYNIRGDNEDKLQWASVGALTEKVDDMKELFVKTAREKEWFRCLLEDVVKQVSKND
ncbi:MAG: hypothetical protein WC295_00850 [Methanoregula sp.]